MKEADFPIADAHQHFWDIQQNYHPWLRDEPPVPFRYGDYRKIRRRYLPADYLADVAPHQVVKTVYVEAEWDPADPIGETRYIERLRAETGFPTVMVAQAWLDREDCAAVLEQQSGFEFVRSIRHKPRANPSAANGEPGGMTDARWRNGFARLAPAGLRFDLQTPWWHLHEAAELARAFPDTTIILNHTGLPSDRSTGALAAWKQAIGTFAACPNAMIKISGLGQPGQAWTVESSRDIVLTAVETFGVERTMFASNFPVDSLCATFDTILTGFRQIVQGFADHEQRALFHYNAVRIYAME
ncbi:MAG: amidohydrolase family protein [Lautropia sp.]|nr:amidohydrolase family protein [Lautropia sp.]